MAEDSNDQSKDLVRKFWQDVFSSAGSRRVDEAVAAGFMSHDLSPEDEVSRENVKGLVEGVQKYLQNPEVSITEQFAAEQDHIVSMLAFRGHPLGDDHDPEELVELNAIALNRIANGEVTDTHLALDSLTASTGSHPTDVLKWRFPWW